MRILFNVNHVTRNEQHEVDDSICIILEAEGQHLQECIMHCINDGQIDADAELDVTIASNSDTPLNVYRCDANTL